MKNYNRHKEMITLVAQALGSDLIEKTAFVGGCTTGLLITDDMTRESVRYTEDVDLIISVLGYTGWHKFSQLLQARGFKVSLQDTVNCRFRLGSLQVDFMPDDAEVLGFVNQWYAEALAYATHYDINDQTQIRLVTPPYFLATKLEAYKGRGNNDILSSHDIEDLLNVVEGRPALSEELKLASPKLKSYLSFEIDALLSERDTLYAIQSTCQGDNERQQLLYERLKAIADLPQ